MSEKPRLYEQYVVKGHPAWFTPDPEETDIQVAIRMQKQHEMEGDGTWPSSEYLATLEHDQRMHVVSNAMAIIDDFVEFTYFSERVSKWLLRYKEFALHDICSEQRGYRVVLDFVTEAGQTAFLKDHPKWTTTKPRAWFDTPGVVEIEEQWGRNEFYDLPTQKCDVQ